MMKIVAVIPARAGSKGIPNKNLRLINNYPLIWYSIKNALNSKLITDIIVTTDSKEIEIISKQMGVSVKKREQSLCQDSVTLDAVIYDACKDIECDYVVTLQPTSPTLKPETLDEAIQYSISKKLDTLISVINSPHLSWKDKDGKKVPNYKKRLNRQYLPKNYVETGAFLIARKDVISKDTRIGSNVDVYEISEKEAIDIDTFQDLNYAQLILQEKKIAMYVNGNNIRGMGHIYRALELADEFDTKPDIFYDINQTDKSIFGKTTHKLIGVDGMGELLQIIKEKKYTLFINDILSTSIDYMIAVKRAIPQAKIINFEDDGEGIYKADLVINALYQNTTLPHVKTGEKYYISSKLFMFYNQIKIKEDVQTVLLSFGGADPKNYTERLIDIITQDKYKDLKFNVVVGRAKVGAEKFKEYDKYPNISILYDVKNMPEIMSHCDIGITSRGRTCYELAMLGIPSIVMAQNEREERHEFASEHNGFTYLGLDPTDHIIEMTLDMYLNTTKDERLTIQKKMLKNDLRNGRKNILSLINSL